MDERYQDYLKKQLDKVFQKHSYSASYPNDHRDIEYDETGKINRNLEKTNTINLEEIEEASGEKIEKVSNSFYKVTKGKEVEYYCTSDSMKQFVVNKTDNGFSFTINNNDFNVKYEPIMVYGSRYVLCRHKNGKNLILYDKNSNKYQDIGTAGTIEYDGNFILNYRINRVYFMYRNEMIDITEYYCKYLKDKKKIYINRDTIILSKEDFLKENK